MSNENIPINVKCKYHPSEVITNFCKRIECLVELCPKCVVAHSEKHERNHTLISIQDIKETLQTCHELIKKQKGELKTAENAITKYMQDWKTKKQQVSQKLEKAEDDIITAVHLIFDELKKSYETKILEEERNLEKQFGGKLTEFQKMCQSQNESLDYYSSQLKDGTHSSFFIKPLYTDIIPQCEETVKNIKKDFDKLSRNEINLEYEKQILINDIKNSIVDNFQLSLVYFEEDDSVDEFSRNSQAFKQSKSIIKGPKSVSPNIKYSVAPLEQRQTHFIQRAPLDQVRENHLLTSSSPNWKVYY